MVGAEEYAALHRSIRSNNLSDCPSPLSSRTSSTPTGIRTEVRSRDRNQYGYEPDLDLDFILANSVIRWYVRAFTQRRRPGTFTKSMLLVGIFRPITNLEEIVVDLEAILESLGFDFPMSWRIM